MKKKKNYSEMSLMERMEYDSKIADKLPIWAREIAKNIGDAYPSYIIRKKRDSID